MRRGGHSVPVCAKRETFSALRDAGRREEMGAMPVTGRKPKAPGQAVTRHAQTHDWVEIENVPFEAGRELPETRSDGRPWSARIRAKWDAWRSMPHAKLWGSAEWDFALDTIEIAALLHEKGSPNLATELRNREKVLGTTLDYLRALRIRYVDPKPEGDVAGVTNIADYRDL
jgi:hypothetical protein